MTTVDITAGLMPVSTKIEVTFDNQIQGRSGDSSIDVRGVGGAQLVSFGAGGTVPADPINWAGAGPSVRGIVNSSRAVVFNAYVSSNLNYYAKTFLAPFQNWTDLNFDILFFGETSTAPFACNNPGVLVNGDGWYIESAPSGDVIVQVTDTNQAESWLPYVGAQIVSGTPASYEVVLQGASRMLGHTAVVFDNQPIANCLSGSTRVVTVTGAVSLDSLPRRCEVVALDQDGKQCVVPVFVVRSKRVGFPADAFSFGEGDVIASPSHLLLIPGSAARKAMTRWACGACKAAGAYGANGCEKCAAVAVKGYDTVAAQDAAASRPTLHSDRWYHLVPVHDEDRSMCFLLGNGMLSEMFRLDVNDILRRGLFELVPDEIGTCSGCS